MSIVRASFRCAVCGNLAATVWLLPPGLVAPDLRVAGTPARPAEPEWFVDVWRLSIVGGPSPMTVGPVLEPVRVTALLQNFDALGLAAINPEYANFRCPKCPANYCRTHWTDIVPEHDQGFYDATFATCPRGHRVMVDD